MQKTLKTVLAASAALAALAAPALAQDDIKVGIILGFTGPIESLTPDMGASAELAMKEASDSGLLLGGATVTPVSGDSTCVDAAAATATAERLVTSDNVAAIVGADCSGVTTAIAESVAIPNGVVMVSPSATSPALTMIEDNGYFFRTAPSDARQGEVLADVVYGKGIDTVAITYTNNDYGKGLADSFAAAFEALGGTVAATAAHEDGKADYAAEVAALSASGAENLAVFGYVDQGGKGIIQNAMDTGAFSSFILGDGMIGQSLIDNLGDGLNGNIIGTAPGSDSSGAQDFDTMAMNSGIEGTGPYRGESYDAAALILLAMQAAGSADRAAIQSKIMDVANAPGEPIGPGEIARGLEILAGGGDVDYVGATNVELIEPGEAAGSYKVLAVEDGAWVTEEVR